MNTETAKNLRTLRDMCEKRLNENMMAEYMSLITQHKPIDAGRVSRMYDEMAAKLYRQLFYYATSDYEVGEPSADSSAITSPMSVSGMHGCIMFRDNELTSHT